MEHSVKLKLTTKIYTQLKERYNWKLNTVCVSLFSLYVKYEIKMKTTCNMFRLIYRQENLIVTLKINC